MTVQMQYPSDKYQEATASRRGWRRGIGQGWLPPRNLTTYDEARIEHAARRREQRGK